MKIEGKISANINRDNHTNETVIRIRDANAAIDFIEVKLNPTQFVQLLGGLGNTSCEVDIKEKAFDKLGKHMVTDTFEFRIPERASKEEIRKMVLSICPEGWTPDTYFGSQRSFFQKEGESWARTIIRKWVDKLP